MGLEEAESLADVQRFFMLLRPSKAGVRSRLCVVGKKRLPSARKHEVGGQAGARTAATASQPSRLLQLSDACTGKAPVLRRAGAHLAQPVRADAHPSTCSPACLPACLPACPPARPPACLSLPACLPACLSLPACLQRFFGFVEASSEDAGQLLQGMGPQTYETKTRGGCWWAAHRPVLPVVGCMSLLAVARGSPGTIHGPAGNRAHPLLPTCLQARATWLLRGPWVRALMV